MKRNLVFVFFFAAGRVEIGYAEAWRRFRWRQSEQNCRRLSRNQVLAVLELTLCANRRQREALSPKAQAILVTGAKNIAPHTYWTSDAAAGCAMAPQVPFPLHLTRL
jgi:hypothetical protein